MPSPRTLSALLLLLSATTSPYPLASDRSATARSNNASTQLIETASQQYADGHPDQAAATLERALQIQPNNPATLHYLGVLRLQQGQFQQAETLAARSNLRVGANQALRNRNLQLIAAAQTAQRTGVVPTRAVTVPVQDAIAARPSAPPLQPVAALGSEPNEIPRGLRPPPGKCRIWFPDRPPGHQPAPVKCKKLKGRVPMGAYLVRH
ncbi:tetratricopeptide repeat protein [Pseudomonas oryziphila]|uniref:Tetratricopeptide repeat protein n=1 Tax=Pseudomonas oryziphila TaxID=2894079 RepID=A0ABN5TK04_9PSED|nr:tetratricopeptide repeat protein [Pseudomonas oryziphila]AZL73503.1 tetratricopeptide repeat protein [Pseudomonas oryziphila]